MSSNNTIVVEQVSGAGAKWVREAAALRGTTESVVVRAMFSVATTHPDEVDAKILQLKAEDA